MGKLRIKQVKSSIGRRKDQGATLKALGIGKIGQEVIQEDNAVIRGMAGKISHLVEVEEVK